MATQYKAIAPGYYGGDYKDVDEVFVGPDGITGDWFVALSVPELYVPPTIPLEYISTLPSNFILNATFAGIYGAKAYGNVVCSMTARGMVDVSGWRAIYVDSVSGNDSSTGDTTSTKKKSFHSAIDRAISLAEPCKIIADEGVYSRPQSMMAGQFRKILSSDLAIIAPEGRCQVGPFDELTWTLTPGRTNVYQATRSNMSWLVDPSAKDKYGNHLPAAKIAFDTDEATTLGNLDGTPGAWYSDNSTVWFHQSNSEVVTNENARGYLNSSYFNGLAIEVGANTLYLEGIDFEGGIPGGLHIVGADDSIVIIKDCTSRYAIGGQFDTPTASDGLQYLGGGSVFIENCDFSHGSKDGFNFHISGGRVSQAVLVNSIGRHNGKLMGGVTSCNGATTHDGASLIAFGGEYTDNIGTGFGHVNDGTQVFAAFTKAGNSNGDGPNGGSNTWGAFGIWSGDGEMWLDSCEGAGSIEEVYAGGGAKVYLRNHSGTGDRVEETGGTIESY